jgi:hypothetical protein
MLIHEAIPTGARFTATGGSIIDGKDASGAGRVYTKVERWRSIDSYGHDYWSSFFEGAELTVLPGQFVTEKTSAYILQYRTGGQYAEDRWQNWLGTYYGQAPLHDPRFSKTGEIRGGETALQVLKEFREKNMNRDVETRKRPGHADYKSVATNYRLVEVATTVTVIDQDFTFDPGV